MTEEFAATLSKAPALSGQNPFQRQQFGSEKQGLGPTPKNNKKKRGNPKQSRKATSAANQNQKPDLRLPINAYPLNKVKIEVAQEGNYQDAQDILVVIKHTVHEFINYEHPIAYRATEDADIPQREAQDVFEDCQQVQNQRSDIQRFWHKRYFLFSRFDRGVKLDKEGWYSVTPEPIASYLSKRVSDTFREYQGPVNVLDAFVGVGGNLTQFALKCGFCVGVDMEAEKVEISRHNAMLYDLVENQHFQVLHSDFLKLPEPKQFTEADYSFESISNSDSCNINFPNNRKEFDAVFLSPPWGGSGYYFLNEYTLDHIYPDFDQVINKASKYSENLMLFLPRNTSIKDLVKRLAPYHKKLMGDKRRLQIEESEGALEKSAELTIEIQRLMVGDSCKALLVYTGDLAQVKSVEVAQHFIDTQCTNMYKPSGASSNSSMHSGKSNGNNQYEYLRSILGNIFSLCGYRHFTKYFKRAGKSRISLQKIVKQLQGQFSEEEWYYLRKIHKKEHNFFLNKGGTRGSSGSGWKARSTKSSKSISSAGGVSLTNSLEDHNVRLRHVSGGLIKRHGGRGRGTSVDFSGTTSHNSRNVSDWDVDSASKMKMIDEAETSQESDIEKNQFATGVARLNLGTLKESLHENVSMSSGSDDWGSECLDNEESKDEDMLPEWQTVRPRRKKAVGELRDLSETDLLDLIASKNQESRFYGWLHFQPLFQDCDQEKEECEDLDDGMQFFNDLQNAVFEDDD